MLGAGRVNRVEGKAGEEGEEGVAGKGQVQVQVSGQEEEVRRGGVLGQEGEEIGEAGSPE